MKKFERLFAIYKVLHYNTITSLQAPVSGVAKFGTISHFKHGSGYEKEEDGSLPLFFVTPRRGRCFGGGVAELSA